MKLYIESGLPGSGKTTHAKTLVANGNTARINYDDLRAMLWGSDGKWSGIKEHAMQEGARKLAKEALRAGFNVVIDNTNLTEGHIEGWKSLTKEWDEGYITTEVISHKATVALCAERDRNRERSVQRAVIERMALQYGLAPFDPAAKLVIVDVDGTLADSSWRAKMYLAGPDNEKNDWDKFFAASHLDDPIEPVCEWVRQIYASGEYTVIICSGRSDNYATITCDWLKRNGIGFDRILMRKSSDHRPDDIVKREILNLLPKNQVAFIIDDRPVVLRMWRQVKQEENLPYHVFNVAGACEEF